MYDLLGVGEYLSVAMIKPNESHPLQSKARNVGRIKGAFHLDQEPL